MAQAPQREAALSAWYALGILTLVSLLAVVDRGVLILQAEPIRLTLGMSDLQLGFLQGTGVAIFMGLATYPLGWLADRYDRRIVLSGCVLFWSAAVVGSGLAQNFEQLMIASALVGAGEAGLVPIVYSLIPDLFPEKKRQLANSVYSLASTATNAIGLALCGQIVGWVELLRHSLPLVMQNFEGWRLSFLAVAVPAPLMVLVIATIALRRRPTGARPEAVQADAAAQTEAPAAALALVPYLLAHRKTFGLFYGGVGLAIFAFGAVGSWLAVIYMRVFGQTAQQLGAALGVIALGSTALGFLISVYGVRYFAPRVGRRLNIRALWTACLFAVVTFSMMVFAKSAQQMYAIQGLYILLLTTATMVYPTVLQTLAPRHLRARVVAVQGVLASACYAAAPPITGLVSDQLKHLPNGLILAAVSVAVPALLLATALLYACERNYVKTAEAARSIDGEAAA